MQRSPRVPARAASSSEGRARWLLKIEAGRAGAADAAVRVRGVAPAVRDAGAAETGRAAIDRAATVIAVAVAVAASRSSPRA